MIVNQSEFEIRCEWGENGARQLAPLSDVVVIVDLLSFGTCVDIAAGRGALVYPCRSRDETAIAFAASIGAQLAGGRQAGAGYSLSPQSLIRIPAGMRLVLPSPNGAALSLCTDKTPTLAGCLRNYAAVGSAAQTYGRRVAVVPAGERWPDGSLRPAVEDWLGAGAIISQLNGRRSPEASAALAAFRNAQVEIEQVIRQCSSGKELIERGFEADLALAAALNVSECAPVLVEGAYRHLEA
jgi:2-phosphosulfolactate phosphatase